MTILFLLLLFLVHLAVYGQAAEKMRSESAIDDTTTQDRALTELIPSPSVRKISTATQSPSHKIITFPPLPSPTFPPFKTPGDGMLIPPTFHPVIPPMFTVFVPPWDNPPTAYPSMTTAAPTPFPTPFPPVPWNKPQIGNAIKGNYSLGFGDSIALSFDGKIMAITASNYVDNTGLTIGQTSVYSLNKHKKWIKGATFAGGASVSLSYDGTLLAVGTNPKNETNLCPIQFLLVSPPCPIPGFVTIYQFTGRKWRQIGSVVKGSTAGFGATVALSSNGTVLAIGAPPINYRYTGDTGNAFVYQYKDGDWQSYGLPIAPSGNYGGLNHQFGTHVTISADGSVVGVVDSGDFFGGVYSYNASESINGTSRWDQLPDVQLAGPFAITADGQQFGYVQYNSRVFLYKYDPALVTFSSPSALKTVASSPYFELFCSHVYDTFYGNSQLFLSADGSVLATLAPNNAGVFYLPPPPPPTATSSSNSSGTAPPRSWIQIGNPLCGAQAIGLSGDGSVLAYTTLNNYSFVDGGYEMLADAYVTTYQVL
jgi:hypothetical protein